MGVMKRTIRLTESELRNVISETIKESLNENFNDAFKIARDKNKGLFGFELKNSEGDWQYGDIRYDPNTNKMSCMGVSIEADPDMSIHQNIECLYTELLDNGFYDD